MSKTDENSNINISDKIENLLNEKNGKNKNIEQTDQTTSALAISKSLAGIDFPKNKQEVITYAKQNNVNEDTEKVVDILSQITEQQYNDMSEVETELAKINLNLTTAGRIVENISPKDSPNKDQPTVSEQYVVDKENTLGSKFENADPTAALNLDKSIKDEGASITETADVRGVMGIPASGLAGSASNVTDNFTEDIQINKKDQKNVKSNE